MAIKFHKRQTIKRHRLAWFSKSGAWLVIRPRSLRQPRSKAPANIYLRQEDSDRLLRQRSLYAAQNGDCAFALKGFNHLITRNPGNAADYNNRGLVYFQSGQLALALADYNYAISLDPNLANVYNNRANYYAALGELTLAIEDYDQAIRIDPMNVRAWINQGITFREMELYDQAVENFVYALDINQHSGDPTTQKMLEGHIFAERGHSYHLAGDWNCAIAEYHRALAILDDRDLFTEMGSSFHLKQQLEEWLRELTQPLMSENFSSDLDGV
ncbi:tetratricopeptide repeat protein [filamentous cyanobacterium LEGE 11480]|uniref:Tetratricopeptide repeat protein n=1 Tax=Romeriopsis navalis LEGE 11480 TaxID=2777977 RepID=A0A928Z3V7_9CYAN|nr:tetratricopeptide repeat protein [Romeriopsis navalis]MBE9031084.1 tetratricopeptide repeat protein [Romeriopsis navalis LEGE 11480]